MEAGGAGCAGAGAKCRGSCRDRRRQQFNHHQDSSAQLLPCACCVFLPTQFCPTPALRLAAASLQDVQGQCRGKRWLTKPITHQTALPAPAPHLTASPQDVPVEKEDLIDLAKGHHLKASLGHSH